MNESRHDAIPLSANIRASTGEAPLHTQLAASEERAADEDEAFMREMSRHLTWTERNISLKRMPSAKMATDPSYHPPPPLILRGEEDQS